MPVEDDKVGAILSSLARYSTVNILELMSLTPGLNDDEVQETIGPMVERDLIKLSGSGDEQFVSLTHKGYDYLSSKSKLQMV